MIDVCVIGGGAAGLMAAGAAAQRGLNTVILERNEKVGRKVMITGKGRCNVCNKTTKEDFLNNVVSNSKFLYAAINNFSPEDSISFFENNGMKLKVERGNRVFPASRQRRKGHTPPISGCLRCRWCPSRLPCRCFR